MPTIEKDPKYLKRPSDGRLFTYSEQLAKRGWPVVDGNGINTDPPITVEDVPIAEVPATVRMEDGEPTDPMQLMTKNELIDFGRRTYGLEIPPVLNKAQILAQLEAQRFMAEAKAKEAPGQ